MSTPPLSRSMVRLAASVMIRNLIVFKMDLSLQYSSFLSTVILSPAVQETNLYAPLPTGARPNASSPISVTTFSGTMLRASEHTWASVNAHGSRVFKINV